MCDACRSAARAFLETLPDDKRAAVDQLIAGEVEDAREEERENAEICFEDAAGDLAAARDAFRDLEKIFGERALVDDDLDELRRILNP